MIKRLISWLLAAFCLLTPATAFAEQANRYPATVFYRPDQLPAGLADGEAERVLYVSVLGAGTVATVLPQDTIDQMIAANGSLDAVQEHGLLMTLPEALPAVQRGTFLDVRFENPQHVLLRPTVAQYLGPVRCGPITELGGEYMIQSIDGAQVRSTLTPETLVWYEQPLAVGSGCVAIVNGDVVLGMFEANG